MDKLDFIKIKNFFSAKEPIKDMKMQGTVWKQCCKPHIQQKMSI